MSETLLFLGVKDGRYGLAKVHVTEDNGLAKAVHLLQNLLAGGGPLDAFYMVPSFSAGTAIELSDNAKS